MQLLRTARRKAGQPLWAAAIAVTALAGAALGAPSGVPAAALAAPGVPAAASPALTEISSDPLTNSSGQHATESDPDTVSDGRVVVSAFTEGLSNVISGGASGVGFAVSHDGGRTWTHGTLPGAGPDGPYSGIAAPSAAYDRARHTWLIAFSAGVANPADPTAPPLTSVILVSRSADGGRTWSLPVTVAQARFPIGVGSTGISCDNSPASRYYGNCYTVFWRHNNLGGKKFIEVSASADGGMSWAAEQGTADQATAVRGVPLVQPDGTVVVLIANWFQAAPSTQIRSFASADGGRSWGPSHLVATLSAAPSPLNSLGGFAIGAGLEAAADGAGKIYAAWADCRFRPHCSGNDIVVSTSSNGIDWTGPARVTRTGNNGMPGIGADPLTAGRVARIGITYYTFDPHCQGSNCLIGVRFVGSVDGGATWSRPSLVAGPMRGSWLATLPQGVTGVALTSRIVTTVLPAGNAVTVFPFATAPSGSMFHQNMYTVPGGMPIRR